MSRLFMRPSVCNLVLGHIPLDKCISKILHGNFSLKVFGNFPLRPVFKLTNVHFT
jgi:hypothetical protein